MSFSSLRYIKCKIFKNVILKNNHYGKKICSIFKSNNYLIYKTGEILFYVSNIKNQFKYKTNILLHSHLLYNVINLRKI